MPIKLPVTLWEQQSRLRAVFYCKLDHHKPDLSKPAMNEPTTQILVILLGIISSTTLVLSGLSTQRKRMLIFGIATSLLCAVQYSLAGSTVALLICLIGIVRSFTAIMALRNPVFGHWGFLAAFLLGHTLAFGLTTDWSSFGVLQVFPLIGAYLGTIALFFNHMTTTKMLYIASGGIWLLYQYSLGMYGQMVGESFNLVANAYALIVLWKAEKAGIPETEVENIDTHIIDVLTGAIPVVQEKLTTSMIPVVTATVPIRLSDER